jgi:SPP1 family predicted phage head-tail adaptor
MAFEPTVRLSQRMNRRITIKRSVDVPDSHGGFDTTWQDVATVWAEVISQNGREAVIASALLGVSSYKITVRYGVAVNVADQIHYDGKTLNIRSVDDPDGKRVGLVIFADTEAVQA